MTDLERVSKTLRTTSQDQLADSLDAHLKEDAARDYALGWSHGETDTLKAELAQVREAANAEMKASLGYQAELTRLRATLGQYKQDVKEADAEIDRLREEVENERRAVRSLEQVKHENAKLREAAQRLVDYVQSVGEADWSDTLGLRNALKEANDGD